MERRLIDGEKDSTEGRQKRGKIWEKEGKGEEEERERERVVRGLERERERERERVSFCLHV